MSRTLLLFSSDLERDAAFPDGPPVGVPSGVTGVGLVDAAIGTTRLIAEHRPDAIVFVGTCGAYPSSGLEIGDVVVASGVRIGSGDVASGRMRFPSLLPSVLNCDLVLSEIVLSCSPGLAEGGRVVSGRVACTLGVTESDELAGSLRAHDGCDAENLEAFPVLRAAGKIPTLILLGVTNHVGADGGAEWRANYRGMMNAVGSLAYRIATFIAGVRRGVDMPVPMTREEVS